MYNYKEVYQFDVIEQLSQGEKVFAVDRLKDNIYQLWTMTVADVFNVLNTSKADNGRIVYYMREEKEDVQVQ